MTQLVAPDEPRQDRDPRRAEEDRDGGDQEDQRVDEDDVRRGDDRDHQDRGARSRSLTTMTSRWSQRSTKVPAIGDRSRFGSVAATNTNATRDRGVRDRGDEEGQRDLVDPVAEEADQLARPERRERAVEGEPDVGMTADADADLDPRPAPGPRSRRRAGPSPRPAPAPAPRRAPRRPSRGMSGSPPPEAG